MNFRHLKVEQTSPAVATVTFNRPAKANALHYEHLAEIEAAALAFRDDAETRAVIFTGAGAHFSSGADLTDAGDAYRVPLVQRRRRMRIGERCISALMQMDQITIAAWGGAAMGGGACIATALDFRVGADNCFMQYPEIDLGVNLMWLGLPLLVRLVGAARAKRLVIGGERIQADTLLAWGVLDEQVPPNCLLEAAREMADRYAAKPPVAAQMIKQSVNQIAGALDAAIMHMDVDQNLLVAGSNDRRTAIEAYLAKTTPTFKGN